MSSILDALRKAKEADAARDRSSGVHPTPAGVDEVLSTLGYRRHGVVDGLPRGLPLVGLALLFLFIAWWGWRAWRLMPTPGETEPPTVAETITTPTLVLAPIQRPVVRPTPEPPVMPEQPAVAEPSGAEPPFIADAPSAPVSPLTRLLRDTEPDPEPDVGPRSPEPVEPPPDTPPAGPVIPEPIAPAEPDRFALALYHHRVGDVDQALRYYQELLDRNERAAEVHNNMGLLHRERGDFARARRAFRRAIELAPGYSKALNNLGATLLRDGSTEEAATQLRAAIDADPDNLDAVVNLALAQRTAGYAEAAQATLLEALARDPRSATGHFNLALVYEEAGELTRASEHFRAFLEYGSSSYERLAVDVRARLEILETRLP